MSIREANTDGKQPAADDLRETIRQVIAEFANQERERLEPAYKAELLDEKKKREQLERRLNEVVEESKKSRALAEEVERFSAIKTELQRHGVLKLDLAFRAIRDDVVRTADGRLVVRNGDGEIGLAEYVGGFVKENPELLPARIAGGSGVTSGVRGGSVPLASAALDLDKIRPGMDPADLARIREEVARMAHIALSGQQS